MDEQDKERFLSIAEFLESGYCGDHQQRIQAGAAMCELICMLDETLQELADALAEIISLRRSEGHNADRAIGRLQALRPDSEYLRQ